LRDNLIARRIILPITWNISLVLLSVLVAAAGSFTALVHAQRMRENSGRTALWWMVAGSITLGLAVWSMHFIGMLAFHLPIPLTYDLRLTLFSIVPVIAAALLGFGVLRERHVGIRRLVLVGLLMGAGISAMHYTGMAALKMSPAISYDPVILSLSVAVAVIASWGALLMMYRGDQVRLPILPRYLLGAAIMGLAISGMHYTGMAGTHIQPGSVCLAGSSYIEPNLLAVLVALTSLFWFGGGILAALFDQRMERKNAVTLRQSVALSESLLQAMPVPVFHKDAQGRYTGCNGAFSEFIGKPREDIVGKTVFEVSPKSFSRTYRDKDLELLDDPAGVQVYESQVRHSDGSVHDVVFHKARMLGDDGRPSGIVGVILDITQRKQAEQQIHQLAFFDPLTELPNRRLLMDRLHQELAIGARTGQYGAILFLDLDNFKTLNDSKGHDIGDLLLVEVARRLTSCVRDGDTVARLGGDEFVVVLESLNKAAAEAAKHAEQVAEKLRAALSEPYLLKQHQYHSTPSIGVALFCGHQDSLDDLLKYADTAMYQAKTAGRNAIRFYDPAMQAAIEARAELADELHKAIAGRQLRLHYQIQVDALGLPLGSECQLRWEHPERGMISSQHFIPLSEDTGLIVPIGLWVLQTACAQLAAWQHDAAMCELSLAVNVSARQLHQPDFALQVRRILTQSGVKPWLLRLELTESTVLENVEDAIAKMRELRLLGVSFSMDDFGTGYSSLQYLKRLPLDQIKIDRSFVRDITRDPNDAVIVQTIIAMGKALGLDVIAEGVETEEQRDFLERHGCRAFQGYLYSQPVPLEQFEAFVLRSLPERA
jgi:diguanylate cyclase (GGDEF)-like protein/PAS domain S-box-containing protein